MTAERRSSVAGMGMDPWLAAGRRQFQDSSSVTANIKGTDKST